MAPNAFDLPNDEQIDRILGYLNFSTGVPDPRFLADFRDVFSVFVKRWNGTGEYLQQVVLPFRDLLINKAESHRDNRNPTFKDIEQLSGVLEAALVALPVAYRHGHQDLLFHQRDEFLFNSFFLARACESILRTGGPWSDLERVVDLGLSDLNDYIGHRPVAALESRKIEPYPKEFVRPVPVYIETAGISEGPYEHLVERAIGVLADTDPNILRAAHFDLGSLKELAVEPRAFEFDHPINRRPNHHFGQWDERSVGRKGLYERFVVHQVTLDSLVGRVSRALVDEFGADWSEQPEAEERRQELVYESSCALAGTMLMASGICGRGPNAHDSTVTLGSLLPVIAGYRDEFYHQLIEKLPAKHRDRLIAEANAKHQPFGGVRQDLNAELSKQRAAQMVSCRMATIYARMGYHQAAEAQANVVPMASVRLICKIDCLLSSANLIVDDFRNSRLPEDLQPSNVTQGETPDLSLAINKIPEAFALLKRGIECGAIVDPWNILGFDANYSLFPALENTVPDHRVYDLVDLVERILYLCSRLWAEAAGSDQSDVCDRTRTIFQEISDWWRKYAAHEVASVDAVDPQDIFYAAELVATALNLWYKGGAETGDIAFWSNHAGLFDSPKAYALVIDALLQHRDYTTSMALLIHWLSESEFVDLQQGDSSFYDLVFRWVADQRQRLAEADASGRQTIWNSIRKFYDYLEANAEDYWTVPSFELGTARKSDQPKPGTHPENDEYDEYDFEDDEEGLDSEDSSDDLYNAAYEGVTYLDSTDDGVDGEIFDTSSNDNSELEEEVQRVSDRLDFTATLTTTWGHVASVPLPKYEEVNGPALQELKDQLAERQAIFNGWIEQATRNRTQLIELLASVHQFKLPQTGTDPESLTEYDRCRQMRDALLEQAIRTCVDTENAIRILKSVIRAIDQLLHDDKKEPSSLTEASGDPSEKPSFDSVERIFSAIALRDRDRVIEEFPALISYMQTQAILYVPLGRGGNPANIVRARINQSIVRELLASLPSMGLITQTHQLTSTALQMERNNPIMGGAVTEFDDLFEVAFKAIVKSLVVSTGHLKKELAADPNQSPQDVKMECENILFDCVEKLTESFLLPWLDHNETLRLSVLEKAMSSETWNRLVDFIKRYGDGLFTKQFLQLSNLRAILHRGVDNWLSQIQESHRVPDLRLFDELGQEIGYPEATNHLTVALEAVVENYGDYCDYITNTTQSDQGSYLYIFLDFLRLRAKYERVCWKLKPVVWAHEILVREQINGVAKMWRRNLRERVGPEADRYLAQLNQLRATYSIQMVTIGRRLEERFGHPMQIDRLRALIAPAMKDPNSKKSQRTFEKLHQEVNTFARSMLGVGMELPSWLAAIESEVERNFLPERYRDKSLLENWIPPEVLPIQNLREQLEGLPVKKILQPPPESTKD